MAPINTCNTQDKTLKIISQTIEMVLFESPLNKKQQYKINGKA